MKIIYRTLSFRDTEPIVNKEVVTASGVINNVLLITTNLGLTLTGQTVSLILSICVGSLPRYMKGCACNIEIMKIFSFESAIFSGVA